MNSKIENGDRCRDQETEVEIEAPIPAKTDASELRPYTRRSDLPFIRMAERYGGVMMKEDDE